MDGRILELLRSAPLIDGHNDLLWALRETREKTGDEPDVARPTPHAPDGPAAPRCRRHRRAVLVGLRALAPAARRGSDEDARADRRAPRARAALPRSARAGANGRRRRADRRRRPDRVDDRRRGRAPFGGSLGVLRILARLGAGYLTLTHNDDTPWADSATGEHPHGGLTAVRRGSRPRAEPLAVCSSTCRHVSDDTMRQAIEVSEAPVIFSHSSSSALCDVTRNVPDDVLELVGRTGGVVMVTFVPRSSAPEGAEVNRASWDEGAGLRASYADDPEALRGAMEEWCGLARRVRRHGGPGGRPHRPRAERRRDRPRRCRRRLRRRGRRCPQGLEDVSVLSAPCSTSSRARGYSDDELRQIAGRNVLRVMREAELVAAKDQPAR